MYIRDMHYRRIEKGKRMAVKVSLNLPESVVEAAKELARARDYRDRGDSLFYLE